LHFRVTSHISSGPTITQGHPSILIFFTED
jgi:hypothetical protein